MRNKRLNKFKREKSELDIDITSLLDILVILLVFLLRSYNASDLTVNLKSDMELADSASTRLGNDAVIVQLNKKGELWANEKYLGNAFNSSDKIIALYDELKVLDKEKSDEKNEPAKRKPINLIFDKDLEYTHVKKVMHTASLAGHEQFKFIIRGNE